MLLAAFGLLFVSVGYPQKKKEEGFSKVFSSDYDRALRFVKSEQRIDSIIRSQGLNPKEVMAIVFPELIRYNSVQDKVETFALETLYVQYGKDYANFSVGEFQIKPSFAERIEVDLVRFFGQRELSSVFRINVTDTLQSPENRQKRLKRIKDKSGMAGYVCAFVRIMNTKYPAWPSKEEKIKFFASAYNCGYWKSTREIISYQSKKFFHTGLSATSTKFCYSDIAWYYFQQP